MSDWKGFLTESKFFMSYPGYYRNGNLYFAGDYRPQVSCEDWAKMQPEIRKRKLKFWLVFPGAWLRFYWFTLRDLFLAKWHNR